MPSITITDKQVSRSIPDLEYTTRCVARLRLVESRVEVVVPVVSLVAELFRQPLGRMACHEAQVTQN